MERSTFYALLSKICPNTCFNSASNRQHPIAVQLSVTLFRLGAGGDGASIGKIAALFGIGDGGSLDIITKRVFRAIFELEAEYLKWPDDTERSEMISATFHEMPHCIGYVDGSEVKLAERPSKDADSYYSRKQNFSLKIQAVCDYRYRIRHVHIGYPGSVHDSRIYTNSSLYLNPDVHFKEDEWIAGDSAYKLSRTVVTPFQRNSTESNFMTTTFNKLHSKYRVRIEHCFGMLKERFGSLKELRMRLIDAYSSEYACKWIAICCILHNFILECNENIDDFNNYEIDESGDIENNLPESSDEDSEGEVKRKAIYALMVMRQ